MKIYISGKITGDTKWRYKFSKAEAELKDKYPKAEILSPLHAFNSVSLNVQNPTENVYFFNSLRLLMLHADTIYMLPDWKESEGAKIEYLIAKKLRLKII